MLGRRQIFLQKLHKFNLLEKEEGWDRKGDKTWSSLHRFHWRDPTPPSSLHVESGPAPEEDDRNCSRGDQFLEETGLASHFLSSRLNGMPLRCALHLTAVNWERKPGLIRKKETETTFWVAESPRDTHAPSWREVLDQKRPDKGPSSAVTARVGLTWGCEWTWMPAERHRSMSLWKR